jgi:periplasmic mercuric ion binding protein
MRKLFVVPLVGLLVAGLSAGQAAADSVEVKGPHICCKQCVNVVGKLLGSVDGVSEVKADPKTKMVTFTAKDEKAAKAGVKALFDGGLFGSATSNGKELKVEVPAAKKGEKADAVIVKNVHVCCGQCQNGIKATFKDAKITFTDPSGPQRTVTITAPGLEPGGVLEALRKAGFNGSVDK